MKTGLINALGSCLNETAALYMARLDTFCVPIVGVLNSHTVNLPHIAGSFPTRAEISSNHCCLQRFLEQVTRDYSAIAGFVVREAPRQEAVRKNYDYWVLNGSNDGEWWEPPKISTAIETASAGCCTDPFDQLKGFA